MSDYSIRIVVEGVDRASGPLGNVAGSLQRIGEFAAGGVLAAGVTAAFSAVGRGAGALVGGLVGATEASADLSAQIASIGAVSGLAGDDLGQLSALVDELGMSPTLKVTANEAADAIEMLARNGMEMSDILAGGAESTVLLANATGAQFSTAADVATDAMAVFNIEAAQMGSAVDGIAGVVNRSKFSIEDYALALAQGGGVAATAGVEFDDFNAAIAGMAPLFASGSDAGTSFKVMLQRLQPQSKEAAGAMARLGLITEDGSNVFYDAAGNLRDMGEVVGELHRAFGGLSEAERTAALGDIFGQDAMRAAAALAGMTRDEFEALQRQIGEVSSLEMARTRVNNLAGDLDILRGVVETTKLQIGRGLEPVGRAWAQALTPVLVEIGPKLGEISALIGEGIVALTPDIQAFSDAWVMPSLDAFVENLGEAKLAMEELDQAGAGIGDKIAAGLLVAFGGEYTVDADAEITTVTWGDYTYSYDATSAITSIDWLGESGSTQGFVYDAAAGVVSVDYTSALDRGGYSFVYDVAAGVQEVYWSGGEGGFTYQYSATAQVWSVGWGDFQYRYDADAQISTVFWGDHWWAYDADADISVVQWGGWTHTYDGKVSVVDVLWGKFEYEYPVTARVVDWVWSPLSQWGEGRAFLEQNMPGFAAPVTPVISGEPEVEFVGPVDVPGRVVVSGEPEVEFVGPVEIPATPVFSATPGAGWGVAPVEIPVTPVFSATPGAGWGIESIETPAAVSEVIWGNFTNTYDVEAAVASAPAWGSFTNTYDVGAVVATEPDWGNYTHEYTATVRVREVLEPGGQAAPSGRAVGGWVDGGAVMVGEFGPELVTLPAGSRVATAGETRQGERMGAPAVQVVVNATVQSEMDVHSLAYRVADEIRRWRQ